MESSSTLLSKQRRGRGDSTHSNRSPNRTQYYGGDSTAVYNGSENTESVAVSGQQPYHQSTSSSSSRHGSRNRSSSNNLAQVNNSSASSRMYSSSGGCNDYSSQSYGKNYYNGGYTSDVNNNNNNNRSSYSKRETSNGRTMSNRSNYSSSRRGGGGGGGYESYGNSSNMSGRLSYPANRNNENSNKTTSSSFNGQRSSYRRYNNADSYQSSSSSSYNNNNNNSSNNRNYRRYNNDNYQSTSTPSTSSRAYSNRTGDYTATASSSGDRYSSYAKFSGPNYSNSEAGNQQTTSVDNSYDFGAAGSSKSSSRAAQDAPVDRSGSSGNAYQPPQPYDNDVEIIDSPDPPEDERTVEIRDDDGDDAAAEEPAGKEAEIAQVPADSSQEAVDGSQTSQVDLNESIKISLRGDQRVVCQETHLAVSESAIPDKLPALDDGLPSEAKSGRSRSSSASKNDEPNQASQKSNPSYSSPSIPESLQLSLASTGSYLSVLSSVSSSSLSKISPTTSMASHISSPARSVSPAPSCVSVSEDEAWTTASDAAKKPAKPSTSSSSKSKRGESKGKRSHDDQDAKVAKKSSRDRLNNQKSSSKNDGSLMAEIRKNNSDPSSSQRQEKSSKKRERSESAGSKGKRRKANDDDDEQKPGGDKCQQLTTDSAAAAAAAAASSSNKHKNSLKYVVLVDFQSLYYKSFDRSSSKSRSSRGAERHSLKTPHWDENLQLTTAESASSGGEKSFHVKLGTGDLPAKSACSGCEIESKRELEHLSEILPVIAYKLTNFNLAKYMGDLKKKSASIGEHASKIDKCIAFYEAENKRLLAEQQQQQQQQSHDYEAYDSALDLGLELNEENFDNDDQDQEDLSSEPAAPPHVLKKASPQPAAAVDHAELLSKLSLIKRILGECSTRLAVQANYLTELDALFARLKAISQQKENANDVAKWTKASQTQLVDSQAVVIEFARKNRQNELTNMLQGFSFNFLVDILNRFFSTNDLDSAASG